MPIKFSIAFFQFLKGFVHNCPVDCELECPTSRFAKNTQYLQKAPSKETEYASHSNF